MSVYCNHKSGAGVAQRLCNGLAANDPQGTVNGGAVSK